MEIGYFSTDFVAEPAPNSPGKKMMSFGGTYWYRGAMPAIELNKHGYNNHLSWSFRVAPDGHIQTMDTEGNYHDPDIFYSQRWMHKDGPEQIRRARACGQICIADLDDDFWSLGKTNIAYHTTDPKNNPEFNREHYWKMLGECDAITVSTAALEKRVKRLDVPTFILRNAIDLERWQPNDPTNDGMIGWVGGIQWRAHDLHILKPSLPQFLAEYNLPMYHGGDSQVQGVPKFWQQIGIDPLKTKCVTAPLCHIAAYPRLWQPINISLIPLENVAFNQSKSWLKQLESCAAGVPYIVSSGFHEQDLLLDEGTSGRVARNEKPQEWYDHLTDLLDADVRHHEGKLNRQIAEQHDIRLRWTDWDSVYRQLL